MSSDSLQLNSQCLAIVYKWKTENVAGQDLSARELAASTAYDISEHVKSFSYSKNKAAPSGAFQLILENSKDWKAFIKPGQWLTVYLANDGALPLSQGSVESDTNIRFAPPSSALKNVKPYLRLLGIVDRVSTSVSTDSKGSLNITYEVSGRDFGAIYEDTYLWLNQLKSESASLKTLNDSITISETSTVDRLLKLVHDIFLFPKAAENLNISGVKGARAALLDKLGGQWLMPTKLFDNLDLSLEVQGENTYFGNISGLKNFDNSPLSVLAQNPLNYINGGMWEKLKSLSIQSVYELFPELDDSGNPHLNFRFIPWGINLSNYPDLAGSSVLSTLSGLAQSGAFPKAFKDLITDAANIEPLEIVSFNLGEDNHNRYTHFLTTSQTTMYNLNTNIEPLKNSAGKSGKKYPYADKAQIQRYGFRLMHTTISTPVENLLSFGTQKGKDGKPDTSLLLQINDAMYDFWSNFVNLESGTVSIVGRSDIRAGKGLILSENVPYSGNKLFYIEGYTDEFSVSENGVSEWSQTLTVTRGTDLETIEGATQSTSSSFTSLDALSSFISNLTSQLTRGATGNDATNGSFVRKNKGKK